MIRLGAKNVNRIMSASGAWAVTKDDMDHLVSNFNFKTIISKTCTITPKSGNPSPNFINLSSQKLSLNCMGMPNKGYQYYRDLLPYYNARGVNYILSVDGTNIPDLMYMLADYSQFVKSPEIVEINLSCPNTSNIIPSYSVGYLEELLFSKLKSAVLPNINIGLKLSPILDPELLLATATVVNKFSQSSNLITHLVCSNSIPNGLLLDDNNEPVLSNIYGGISGLPAKLIAMSNVARLRKLLEPNIQIIGCGGIENMKDVEQYFSVGASGVQVGRAIYTNDWKSDFLES